LTEKYNNAELKTKIFQLNPAICRTGLLPAQSRYLGLMTETLRKVGSEEGEYTDGQNPLEYDRQVKELKITADDETVRPLTLMMGDKRQVCPYRLNADFKDMYKVGSQDGWRSLVVPNKSELRYYNWPTFRPQGVIMICQVKCPWGKCPGGNEMVTDLMGADKQIQIMVDGKPVTGLEETGEEGCSILSGENGITWGRGTAGSRGRQYEIKMRIFKEDAFTRLSAIIVF